MFCLAPYDKLLLTASFPLQLLMLLSKVDEWQFDMFALEEATFSHSLSVLGFALIKRTDVFKKYRMDEAKLAR